MQFIVRQPVSYIVSWQLIWRSAQPEGSKAEKSSFTIVVSQSRFSFHQISDFNSCSIKVFHQWFLFFSAVCHMETKPPLYVRFNIPRRIKSLTVTLPVFWMAARSVFWGRESNWLELNNSPQSSCTHTAGKLQTAHWTPERDNKGIRKMSKRLGKKKKGVKPILLFLTLSNSFPQKT